MSKALNVKEIAEFALRRIGAYAPHDSGADPDDFSIAVEALDMLAAEVIATEQPLWMVPATVSVAIPANTNPIDVVTIAGPSIIDPETYSNTMSVVLRDPAGRDNVLTRLNRREYEEAIDNKATPGIPDAVYIDRTELLPKFYLSKVLAVTGYFLRVSFYKTTTQFVPTGDHQFPNSWQRFLSYALAVDIGSGPVATRDESTLRSWRAEAQAARELLFSRQNRETDTPRTIQFRDF